MADASPDSSTNDVAASDVEAVNDIATPEATPEPQSQLPKSLPPGSLSPESLLPESQPPTSLSATLSLPSASAPRAIPATKLPSRRLGRDRWLQGLLLLALLAGITLRFVNIAPKHKAVSQAEVNTALHLSNHRLSDLRLAMASESPSRFLENQTLRQFQQIPMLGDRVTFWRLVSGLFSLLGLPVAWRLGRSLFADPVVSVITLCLLAVSPLHLAFAQEAQPATAIFALILLGQTLLVKAGTRKSWLLYLFCGVGLALVVALLQINPWSSASVATLLLEMTLYWLLALGLSRLVKQGPMTQGQARWPRRLALGGLSLLLMGAIALNTAQVMSFSGWLKGPANGNLALAEVLNRHPGPIISDARSGPDLQAILSLSHHLSDDYRWIFSQAGGSGLPSASTLSDEENTYLYRPSSGLTEAIQATSDRPLQFLQDGLWRWGQAPSRSEAATP